MMSFNIKSFRFVRLAFWLVFLLFCSCAGGGLEKLKRPAYPQAVTDAIRADFNHAEALYRAKQFDQALSAYQNFSGRYGYSRLTDEANYKIGKIHFLQDRLSQAHDRFLALAQQTPDGGYRAKGFFMAGYSSYGLGGYARALNELGKAKDDALEVRLRVQLFSLMHLSAKNVYGRDQLADYFLFRLYDTYEESFDPALRSLHASGIIDYTKLRSLIDAFLAAPLKTADLPAWLIKYPKTPARVFADYKLGTIYLAAGDQRKAGRYLSRLVRTYPKNPYSEDARQILSRIGYAATDAPESEVKGRYKVGVLVPLTGEYAQYGTELLEGIRCAAGEDGLCGNRSEIDLVIEDSGDTPITVREAIDSLEAKGVVALIGPMASALSLEAGVIATQKRIPIFPITQKSSVMEQGDYIFQIGYTPEQQASDLVKAAFDRGFRSFGILYPANTYGQAMAELFSSAVLGRGGRVAASASYQSGETLQADVQKLFAATRGGEMNGVDAFFVPDSYQGINALLPALESAGIAGKPLLGTIAWNDPNLNYSGIAKKYPDSFFVGVYDVAEKSSVTRQFAQNFRAGFGKDPTIISAFGYDTLMIIRKAAGKEGEGKIKQALSVQMGFDGVTGLRGFRAGAAPIFDVKILRVTVGGIKE